MTPAILYQESAMSLGSINSSSSSFYAQFSLQESVSLSSGPSSEGGGQVQGHGGHHHHGGGGFEQSVLQALQQAGINVPGASSATSSATASSGSDADADGSSSTGGCVKRFTPSCMPCFKRWASKAQGLHRHPRTRMAREAMPPVPVRHSATSRPICSNCCKIWRMARRAMPPAR